MRDGGVWSVVFVGSPVPIHVDPVTQQWVMQSSNEFSFTTPEGIEIQGRTSLARTIPEVFKDIALPERWGHQTEHMLIRVDPNDPNDTRLWSDYCMISKRPM